MSILPYALYRGEQVRQIDRYVIETLGISDTILMERAGAAAFAELQRRWLKAQRLVVVCGHGNNGGDGFVLARLAREAGMEVVVLQVGDTNRLQGNALSALQRLQNLDVELRAFNANDLQAADVVVDAVLGTGLHGDVTGEIASVIESINLATLPVLSLDIPSGLDADSGMPHGVAIRAMCTIAFLGLKRGLFTGDGPDYTGAIAFHDLSVPAAAHQTQSIEVERVDYPRYKSLLKPRARTAHKGQSGHVLLIGGDAGYTGAIRLAGEAALRTGAGLVSIATRGSHAALLNANRPELMVHAVEDEANLQVLTERADVIAIGPGLGQQDWGQQMLKLALDSELPLILDADALSLLAHAPVQRQKWVLTPHCAEAARLLGKSCHELHQDRFAAVQALQKQYGGIIVLKGAGTLIAAPNVALQLCSEGNPGMASGGMGDVLTGVIAALVAQGMSLLEASQLGTVLHSAAGDAAAKAAGERGLLASDLMSWLRRLANPVS